MKTTTTLEEMHFSGADGPGLTMRILEKRPGYDPEATRHTLEFEHGARIGLPLGTPAMARYIGEAIIRTADRMDQQPRAGGKYPMFRRMGLADVVNIRGGLRLRPVYEHTTVRGPNSTGADLLGIDWLDDSDDDVRFEALPRHQHHGAGGTPARGEAPLYEDDEIGLMVTEVISRRLAAGKSIDRIAIHPNQREFTTIVSRYVRPGENPETSIDPSPSIISEIVYGLPKDADVNTIRVAIRTFYAIPGYRRNREWRETFAQALAEHLGWKPLDVKTLITFTKAG